MSEKSAESVELVEVQLNEDVEASMSHKEDSEEQQSSVELENEADKDLKKSPAKDVGRRRSDIEEEDDDEDEDGKKKRKGFRRANVNVDDSKVSAAPEESWIINECFPLRMFMCWMTPIVFKGIFTHYDLSDLPHVLEHCRCMEIEKRFDYIWPKLEGIPFRLMIAINYCFGLEFWYAGLIMVFSSCSQVFFPYLMRLFMEDLFTPDLPDAVFDAVERLRDILPSDHDIYPPEIDELKRGEEWYIWAYLGVMAVLYIVNSWGMQYSIHLSTRVGMKVRSLVVTKVYQKSLVLSNKARGKYENGIILNHVSMDALKIEQIHMMFHFGWCSWIIVLGSIGFLVDLIDWGAMSGTLTYFICIPIVFVVMFCFLFLRTFLVKAMDTRVNKTNEVIQSIRIIKYFSWEHSFLKKIQKYRTKEVLLYRAVYFLFGILIAVLISLTSIVCLVAYLTYFGVHGYLDTVAIFTSLTYFNTMRIPLFICPMIIVMLADMLISITRIQKLLTADEIDESEQFEDFETPIKIKGGLFRWEVEKKENKGDEGKTPQEIKKEKMKAKMQKCKACFCCCLAPFMKKNKDEGDADAAAPSGPKPNPISMLCMMCRKKKPGVDAPSTDLAKVDTSKLGYVRVDDLEIKKGSLTIVIGKVGSGKSSLLYAMLGEMKRVEGEVEVSGQVSFTSQLGWMQNETLKNNVLFGEDDDEERWEKVVECCQLQQDLDELKGGKDIEIGEKGINLSGGQKYRVQLARACYAHSDIVLLDDPLAAVDAHVGKKIMDKCVLGFLKERTRVLVTHQLNWLDKGDYIILMDNGEIKEEGTYEELMEMEGGEVRQLHNDFVAQQQKGDEVVVPDTDSTSEPSTDPSLPDKSMTSEEEETEEEIVISDEIVVQAELVEESSEEEKGTSEEEEEEGGENIKVEESSSSDDEDDDFLYDEDTLIMKDALEEAKKNSKKRAKKRKRLIKKRAEDRRNNKVEEEVNKIIQHEEMSTGMISFKVILTYIYSMGCYGILPVILILGVYLWAQACLTMTDIWLVEWTDGTWNEKFSKIYKMYEYVEITSWEVTQVCNGEDDRKPVFSFYHYDPDDFAPHHTAVGVDTRNTTWCNETLGIFRNNSNCTNYTSPDPYAPPPLIDGKVDCSVVSADMAKFFHSSEIYGTGVRAVPFNVFSCPSQTLGWCGCFSYDLPVWWKEWDNGQRIEEGMSQVVSVIIYAAFGMLSLFNMWIRAVVFLNFGMSAAQRLHNRALKRVLGAPMRFFDTTPVGRIVSRFSTDISEVDGRLLQSLSAALGMGFNCVGMFILIGYNTDGIGLGFLIPLFIFYLVFYLLYRKTNLELKRIESVSRSPIMAHVSETLNGLSTIRAYKAKDRFIKGIRRKIDLNNRAWYLQFAAQRWLGINLGILGMIFVLCVCGLLILIFHYWDDIEMSASAAGLTMSYSYSATMMFFNVVQQLCEAEVLFNSVERLNFYAKNIDQESIFEKSQVRATDCVNEGVVEFQDYSMEYRKGLGYVLKDVTFKTEKHERIGIVGRTGSGKSSLMVALWRIVEPNQGQINLDGMDTRTMNLVQLRSALSIIPQDATLFSGTVRSNLDPFGDYKDDELWKALERSYMKKKISKLPGGLKAEMKEGGSNFSVGERQLLCLARALLRNTKVLVLDEATASVDVGTDARIQKTIREAFTECTSLTIAHRLDTIIDSDRILVMDDGRVGEFDTPRELLGNTERYHMLRDLVHETGKANEKMLYDYAFGKKKFEINIEEKKEVEEEGEGGNDDDGEPKKVEEYQEVSLDDLKEEDSSSKEEEDSVSSDGD